MIPMPESKQVEIMKKEITFLMKLLAPTVDTLEIAEPEERRNVGCVEDAYYGLQDALEALEDIETGGRYGKASSGL